METKISRICWNSEGWQFPSGSSGKSASSGSFEAEYRYGHEEWLFDRSRIIEGYHYAFLQPLGLKTDRHVGKTYKLVLFTIVDGTKYSVGKIKAAYCISRAESKDIYARYERQGWLTEMLGELERAGANPKPFVEADPEHFFNIKFRFQDLSALDDLAEISSKDNNITTHRYKLLPMSKAHDLQIAEALDDENEGTPKKTGRRIRVFKGECSFDPVHDKIQNALCELLRVEYKNEYKKVLIERDRVDIKARTHSDAWHYFEIKTDSPKMSIRKALGQIMEYCYWPEEERAEKLFIVSHSAADPETKRYIRHIRNKFGLPVYYKHFDIEKKLMSEDC